MMPSDYNVTSTVYEYVTNLPSLFPQTNYKALKNQSLKNTFGYT